MSRPLYGGRDYFNHAPLFRGDASGFKTTFTDAARPAVRECLKKLKLSPYQPVFSSGEMSATCGRIGH